MKKLKRYICFMLAIATLSLTSCSNEEEIGARQNTVTVSLSAILPQQAMATRADENTSNSAYGALANIDWAKYDLRYTLDIQGKNKEGIWEQANEIIVKTYNDATQSPDVEITLTREVEYRFTMWADIVPQNTKEDYHYNTQNFPQITNNGTRTVNDETRDAYYAVKETLIPQNYNITLQLQRPFAKLRAVTNDVTNPAELPQAVKAEYSGTIYNGVNIQTGQLLNDNNTTVSYTSTIDNSYTNGIDAANDTRTLFIDYLFANAADNNIDVTLTFYSADAMNDSDEQKSVTANDVPLQRNILTTLRGSLLGGGEIIWDKESMTPPTLVDNQYIIDSPDKLAYLQENLLESGKTFVITQNLDMNGAELESLQIPDNSTIIGNGKTIKGAKLDGALFGNASNLTIENLNFENITACSEDTVNQKHVGVLVNTLNGNNTFKNINIINSYVETKNGAAGGFVGYITRKSPNNREETLSVVFDNCHVSNTSIEGTHSEGHFVGLLRGYDNKETLQFKSNCNLTPLKETAQAENEFASLYREGNESVWLADNDYSRYNDWLGNEECYRGTVIYGENRFIPCWDGVTKVAPLTDTDGKTKLIYSAFDLANLQGSAAGDIKLMENVCMEYDLDGASKEDTRKHIFTALSTLSTLNGNGKTIYNITIRDNYYGGFVKSEQCATTFKNVTFDGADIRVTYNESSGDAYVGTLRGFAYAKTTINNVYVKNGYIKGVNKMGGLCGAVFAELDCNSSSVYNYTLENEEILKKDPIFSISSYTIGFYPHGEVGGLFGFISANANIDNCNVTETKLKCVGVKDMSWFESSKIPGRHINQFIGDIRTTSGQKIYINNCYVENNSYLPQTFTSNESEGKETNFSWYYKLKNRASSSKLKLMSSCTYTKITVNPEVELVGCCYYIFCEVYALFGSMYKIMEDTKGELWIDGIQKF